MLTLQDVLFAAGAVVTALFTWLTYRSNNRRNLAAIEEEKKRTEIIRDAYSVKSPTAVAARSDDIAAQPQEQ